MAKLMVHHKVADYNKWRAVYDSMAGTRQRYGEQGAQVLRSASDPNELVILTQWNTAEAARAFAGAAELKDALQKAGVISQPEVLILEDAPGVEQITRQVVAAIEARDFDAARALLSDDFEFSGAVPQPINADAWLGVHRALGAAFSDFSFRFQPAKTTGDMLEGTVQVGGTQDGEFRAPVPGLPIIPATGKRVLNPMEHIRVTARGGKLTNWDVEHVSDGGLAGIVKQLNG
jgi:heme-degrading monooxygenase HmoA